MNIPSIYIVIVKFMNKNKQNELALTQGAYVISYCFMVDQSSRSIVRRPVEWPHSAALQLFMTGVCTHFVWSSRSIVRRVKWPHSAAIQLFMTGVCTHFVWSSRSIVRRVEWPHSVVIQLFMTGVCVHHGLVKPVYCSPSQVTTLCSYSTVYDRCVYTMAWSSQSIVRRVEWPHSVVIQLFMTGVCVYHGLVKSVDYPPSQVTTLCSYSTVYDRCVYIMARPSRSIVRRVVWPHSVVVQLFMTGVCTPWPDQVGLLFAESSDHTLSSYSTVYDRCVYTIAWSSRSIVRRVEWPHSVVIQLFMAGVCTPWPGQVGLLFAESSDHTL